MFLFGRNALPNNLTLTSTQNFLFLCDKIQPKPPSLPDTGISGVRPRTGQSNRRQRQPQMVLVPALLPRGPRRQSPDKPRGTSPDLLRGGAQETGRLRPRGRRPHLGARAARRLQTRARRATPHMAEPAARGLDPVLGRHGDDIRLGAQPPRPARGRRGRQGEGALPVRGALESEARAARRGRTDAVRGHCGWEGVCDR